jgi:hypothetical protein
MTPAPSTQQAVRAYPCRYGIVADRQLNDLEVELLCFRTSRTIEQGGVGKYQHFRNAAAIILPTLQWNPWLEAMIESLCDDHYAKKFGPVIQRKMAWAGAGGSGKTFAASLYAFIWFLAAPMESIVVLTSTSAKMIRKRMWPIISRFYVQVRDQFGHCGHIVDSKTTIQAAKGDDKHAIFAVAVGKGEANKAAANIQGMHAPRIFVVLDEATDVEEAILTAIENLKKNCRDFTELRIGNAQSRLDPLGQAMTPKNGWNSITVDHEEWETVDGYCLHFDGFKSPNVKAGKTIYPHIYTFEDYTIAISRDQKTLECWKYDRGFPPPDGVSNTVLSEALIETTDARGAHNWISTRKTIAGLDPAFGGDRCVLQFGYEGDIETADGSRVLGIQATENIEITFDPADSRPRDTQIAEKTIAACSARNVEPKNFGCDATGTGRGVFAIIYEKWSGEIQRVEFGGKPSELPTSDEDPRPCAETYDRRVTELWFNIQRFVKSGQLKGLTTPVIRELCGRTYRDKSRVLCIETKEEYKERMRHSPDNADALAVLVEVSRRNGNTPTGKTARRDATSWMSAARKLDAANNTEEVEEESGEMFAWM